MRLCDSQPLSSIDQYEHLSHCDSGGWLATLRASVVKVP